MIITIDGPSGTGKSTIAPKVAQKLEFDYFDTGAMYRALACAILDQGINPDCESAITAFLPFFDYHIKTIAGKKHYFIGNKDVTDLIRSSEVTNVASQISIYPSVRKVIVDIQRRLGRDSDAIFEGRDMGSYVFPEAEIKIYLDAQADVRAERRYQEMKSRGYQDLTVKQVLDDINARDRRDSQRQVAPLCCPENAIVIDTSNLNIDDVVEEILKIIPQRSITR
ncbi:MAG: (d)CMP kinase [Chlamydiota bacterium]